MSADRFTDACESGHLSAVQDMVREGVDINTEDSGMTGLFRAIGSEHWALVSWLLDQDTLDINWKNSEYSDTYLHIASECGAPVSVITCLLNGSNVQGINAVTRGGRTALDLAVIENHPDIVSCLGGREEVTWDMGRLEGVARFCFIILNIIGLFRGALLYYYYIIMSSYECVSLTEAAALVPLQMDCRANVVATIGPP